jgi:hypothetical protein
MIKIVNSPSHVPVIVSLPYNNLLSFNVLVLIDSKCLVVSGIDEVFTSSPEELPPFR